MELNRCNDGSSTEGGPAPLPVGAYFERTTFERERRLVLDAFPRYLGHALAVAQPGRYYALPSEGEGRALVHGPDGIALLSNVCRHRQATLLQGRGTLGDRVVCPAHAWSYDLRGALVAAPGFDCHPARDLARFPIEQHHGLLFERRDGRSFARDLSAPGETAEELARVLSLDGHVFDRAVVKPCPYNWKTFVEIYLEDYHVAAMHPGLNGFVQCEGVAWQLGEHHSVQRVGLRPAQDGGGRAASPAYAAWLAALSRVEGPGAMRPGVTWFGAYPTLMIERYPLAVMVSSLVPQGPDRTLNVIEFYYPEEIAAFERELVEAQQAAYLETAEEDDEIALRITAGRRALWERGDDDAGPYQWPMERGMQHFHDWYRKVMGGR